MGAQGDACKSEWAFVSKLMGLVMPCLSRSLKCWGMMRRSKGKLTCVREGSTQESVHKKEGMSTTPPPPPNHHLNLPGLNWSSFPHQFEKDYTQLFLPVFPWRCAGGWWVWLMRTISNSSSFLREELLLLLEKEIGERTNEPDPTKKEHDDDAAAILHTLL